MARALTPMTPRMTPSGAGWQLMAGLMPACWRWGVLCSRQVSSTPQAHMEGHMAGPNARQAWQASSTPGAASSCGICDVHHSSPGKGRQQAQEQQVGCQQQAGVGQEQALVALAHAVVHHRAVVVEALHTPAAGARLRTC